jgi:hypothetical protein
MKTLLNYVLLSLSTLSIMDVRAAEDSITCQVDDDCNALKAGFLCKDVTDEIRADIKIFDKTGNDVTSTTEKYCVHKKLWPLTTREWIGSVVFSLIMLLSNVGGIGGGGVAIPLAMWFFNLTFKPAIAISSFAILVSTLGRFFYNFNERHPDKPACVTIDYGMTNVMMPLTLIGSLIGAYFYKSFPDMILLIILTLLLALLCWESVKKFRSMRAKEDEKLKEKEAK